MAKKEKNNKTNAMRFLEENNIEYIHHTYDSNGVAKDGVMVASLIGVDENRVFKTLCTTDGKGGYYIAVVPSVRHLDLKKLAKALNIKSVDMLNVKDLLKVTGYVRGGCSPFSMKKLYPTVIDETCKDLGKIVVSAGKIGDQVEIPYEALNLINASFEDITMD